MKKLIVNIMACGLSLVSLGQDIHFSQTAQTPLWVNPATTGVYDGWERVTINHRNQWLGANTQFMTTALSADVNFLKTNRNDAAHVGLGVFLYNDVGGDAKFGTRQGSVSLSGILPAGNGHILSAGIQGGIGNKSGNVNALVFESQWNGDEFDTENLPGDFNGLQSMSYIDVSGGLYWEYDGSKNSFARNEVMKFKFGVAGYHLNAPNLEYYNGSSERLFRKYVAHVGLEKEISGSKWLVEVNGVQFAQGPHYQTILGVIGKYRFTNGTKVTGNSQDAYFGFGMYTRIKDAIIPTMLVDWKGFHFGMSYDVTLSALRKTHGGGSLEFSLAYRNLNHALFKRRRFY